MHPVEERIQAITRRHFFGSTAMGLGTAALSSLLPGQTASAAPGARGGLPGLPHFAPKAKRAI